jgi:hypothetical protein
MSTPLNHPDARFENSTQNWQNAYNQAPATSEPMKVPERAVLRDYSPNPLVMHPPTRPQSNEAIRTDQLMANSSYQTSSRSNVVMTPTQSGPTFVEEFYGRPPSYHRLTRWSTKAGSRKISSVFARMNSDFSKDGAKHITPPSSEHPANRGIQRGATLRVNTDRNLHERHISLRPISPLTPMRTDIFEQKMDSSDSNAINDADIVTLQPSSIQTGTTFYGKPIQTTQAVQPNQFSRTTFPVSPVSPISTLRSSADPESATVLTIQQDMMKLRAEAYGLDPLHRSLYSTQATPTFIPSDAKGNRAFQGRGSAFHSSEKIGVQSMETPRYVAAQTPPELASPTPLRRAHVPPSGESGSERRSSSSNTSFTVTDIESGRATASNSGESVPARYNAILSGNWSIARTDSEYYGAYGRPTHPSQRSSNRDTQATRMTYNTSASHPTVNTYSYASDTTPFPYTDVMNTVGPSYTGETIATTRRSAALLSYPAATMLPSTYSSEDNSRENGPSLESTTETYRNSANQQSHLLTPLRPSMQRSPASQVQLMRMSVKSVALRMSSGSLSRSGSGGSKISVEKSGSDEIDSSRERLSSMKGGDYTSFAAIWIL